MTVVIICLACLAAITWLCVGMKKTERDLRLLFLYKKILAAVLPEEMLTAEGLLKQPSGQGESIKFSRGRTWFDFLFRFEEDGGNYRGDIYPKISLRLATESELHISAEHHQRITKILKDRISKHNGRDVIHFQKKDPSELGTLAHEAFHDIQGYLHDYHRDIYSTLIEKSLHYEEAIRDWYTSPQTTSHRGYPLEDVFSQECAPKSTWHQFMQWYFEDMLTERYDDGEGGEIIDPKSQKKARELVSNSEAIKTLIAKIALENYRLEIIPMLMEGAAGRDEQAISILSRIFAEAGLRSDFHEVWPWRRSNRCPPCPSQP